VVGCTIGSREVPEGGKLVKRDDEDDDILLNRKCVEISFVIRAAHLFVGSIKCMSVYPEVSGLAAWRENCKWYSSLPLDAIISLFCKSVW
jgi:hypothetical protein